jgi:nicotinamide-nucleotide amidase
MIDFSNKLIKLCTENNLTISLAESCTGGMIVSKLVAVPGASQVIECSLVAYSNMSKKLYLNVTIETLSKYGAVSKQVSEQMIYGLKNKNKSNIYISTTGIAGPGGGSKKKPVGTVYHSFYFHNKKRCITIKKRYFGTRFGIRLKASQFTIKKTYDIIQSFI